MTNVSLFGDSIRQIGYGLKVPQLLGSSFRVFQPDDNCRFTYYRLRMIHDCRREIEASEVVHYNCGSWDACDLFGDGAFTPLDEYVRSMLRITDLLHGMCKKLVFATTTPVLEGGTDQVNALIVRENEAIVPLLSARGVVINDLYTTVEQNKTRFIKAEDRVHLTEEGIDACARQTADIIRELAGK